LKFENVFALLYDYEITVNQRPVKSGVEEESIWFLTSSLLITGSSLSLAPPATSAGCITSV